MPEMSCPSLVQPSSDYCQSTALLFLPTLLSLLSFPLSAFPVEHRICTRHLLVLWTMANYARSPKMELVISSAIALHSRHGSRRSCMILYSCNHFSLSIPSSNHSSFVYFSLVRALSIMQPFQSHPCHRVIIPRSFLFRSCIFS